MKRQVRLAACALLALLAAPVGAQHAHPHPDGESFQKIEPPQPAGADGKIEVIELFWYGCPHCYAFEPYLDNWLKTRPADVEFVRMPGVLNPSWVQHARAFYTAQKLGVLDRIHMPLFHAIHRDRQRIFSEDELREFFTDNGVDGDDFDRVFRSSEVDTRMKQALFTAKNARVTGVPTILVNGRYMTSGTMTGSFEKMLETTDQLIAMERERLGLAAAPAATPAEPTAMPATPDAPAVETTPAPQAAAPGESTPAPMPETPPATRTEAAVPAPAPAAEPPAPVQAATEGRSPYLFILGLVVLVIVAVFALRGRRSSTG